MTASTRPLAEVTHRAIEALIRAIGPADTMRFVNQFATGFGDYTAERDALIGPMSLDQILAEIEAGRSPESV